MSYISEDDRIDREQAYRRKLREAGDPRATTPTKNDRGHIETI